MCIRDRDDTVCWDASRQEILRRYYTACVDRLQGDCDAPVRKLELVMQQADVTPEILSLIHI